MICAIATALPSQFGVGVNAAARVFSLCILASLVPGKVREGAAHRDYPADA